jgi:hypothetical protein
MRIVIKCNYSKRVSKIRLASILKLCFWPALKIDKLTIISANEENISKSISKKFQNCLEDFRSKKFSEIVWIFVQGHFVVQLVVETKLTVILPFATLKTVFQKKKISSFNEEAVCTKM